MGNFCVRIWTPSYSTPKIVQINNPKLGLIFRICQVVLFVYVILYSIIYKKGYQAHSGIVSSVTTKVKGTVSTLNLADSAFSKSVNPAHYESYRRIWDVADYQVPPSETNAFFVMTNMIITPNQTRGRCAESLELKEARCQFDGDCEEDSTVYLGNGPMTGKCLLPSNRNRNSSTTGRCEVFTWCPIEENTFPLKDKSPVLSRAKDLTVMIKNSVKFSGFNIERRNVFKTQSADFLKSCHYSKETTATTSPYCPIFKLNDILTESGSKFEDVARFGAIFAVMIDWKCDFDWHADHCLPKYSFKRMDDASATVAPGWNFRFAKYFEDDRRTLVKAYGIRFSILVSGTGAQFSIVPLLVNIGSGLGLLAIATIACDYIAFNISAEKQIYKDNKFLIIDQEDLQEGLAHLKAVEIQEKKQAYTDKA